MSEHITHIAVYEDSARLIKASTGKFPKAFVHSLNKSYDSGLVCSGTRGNHLYAVPILEKYKNLPPDKLDQTATEQIAGSIGWITHRAADHQVKPLFWQIDDMKHPVWDSDECQMYHDAIVFKEVYQGGNVSTLSDFELLSPATLSHQMKGNKAAASFNMFETENVLTHFYMAELLKCHASIDKSKDINEYIDEMISNSQDLYEDLRIYIDAYHTPDPMKLMAFIYNFNVYNPDDEIIKIVRAIQLENNYPDEEQIQSALKLAETQSQYSQALKKSYDYLLGAGKFYSGLAGKDETYDCIEIFTESHRI